MQTHNNLGFGLTGALLDEAARMEGLDGGWVLLRRNKQRQHSQARFAVIWVLRQLKVPHRVIAGQLGFDDHKSVFHGHGQAVLLRANSDMFKDKTDRLLRFALVQLPVEAEAA